MSLYEKRQVTKHVPVSGNRPDLPFYVTRWYDLIYRLPRGESLVWTSAGEWPVFFHPRTLSGQNADANRNCQSLEVHLKNHAQSILGGAAPLGQQHSWVQEVFRGPADVDLNGAHRGREKGAGVRQLPSEGGVLPVSSTPRAHGHRVPQSPLGTRLLAGTSKAGEALGRWAAAHSWRGGAGPRAQAAG